jgi:LPXTG-motif cell wall-anchored protein
MNKMSLYRVLFFLSLVCFSQQATGQGEMRIKAAVNKNKILIGESLKLTVEITVPSKYKGRLPIIDSIEHFEFLQPPQIDSSLGANSKELKTVYTLTSFDSGHWVIPSFVLNAKIKSDTIPVDIAFSEFNREQDYHDIKDIIEVKEKEKKDWFWYAVAGTVLILLLIYLLLRKKKKPVPVAAPALNAYEEAMKQLTELKKQSLSGKDFHTKLVEIFKLYVLRKKNILSLQKTTDGLVMQLRTIMTDKDKYNQLQQTLQLSDFVKFAKYQSTVEDDTIAFETMKNTIQYLEQLP